MVSYKILKNPFVDEQCRKTMDMAYNFYKNIKLDVNHLGKGQLLFKSLKGKIFSGPFFNLEYIFISSFAAISNLFLNFSIIN